MEYRYTHPYDFCHFAWFYGAVSVDVIHLECPFQFLFRLSSGSYVNSQKEFLEIDLSAVVRVECSEDVFAELVGIALGEEARINLEKLRPCQLTIRTIFLEFYGRQSEQHKLWH
jgi:hypothetical protein